TVQDEITVTSGDPLDVVLTWYSFTQNISDTTSLLTVLRAPVVNGRFQLDAFNPPPEVTRFALGADDGQGIDVSVGFLSVVNRRIAPEFNWADPDSQTEGDRFPVVGGREDVMVLYLDGSSPVDPPLPWSGGDLQPGYNLVALTRFDDLEDTIVYERLPRNTSVTMDVSGDWFPAAEACGFVQPEPPFELLVSDEDFPSPVPEGQCGECGGQVLVEVCEVYFDALCAECVSLQLVYDSVLGEQWPCIPRGPCDPEGEVLCALDQRFTCMNGQFQRIEDCTAGGDCCESGCVPVQ
ncbi:MAG: hypothetical protein AAF658_09030, partial [Myxococcota bacterium]